MGGVFIMSIFLLIGSLGGWGIGAIRAEHSLIAGAIAGIGILVSTLTGW